MLDPANLPDLREAVQDRARKDQRILTALREDVRPLRTKVTRINPRSATAVSLVASDGGNNKIQFDPFLMQIVRVVDSYGQQLYLDVVSPTTSTEELSARHFDQHGSPATPIGVLMHALGVRKLYELSHMIPRNTENEDGSVVSPSWVLVYRDLCEWAVLFERITRAQFATDTLIVRDGLLRSKAFRGDLFIRLRTQIAAAIEEIRRKSGRKIYLVGVAKHSEVLKRYALAMSLEGILQERFPCYLEIPRSLEKKVYVWPEWARGVEEDTEGTGEAPKFVAGRLFLVKFGSAPRDPIWAVDVADFQVNDHPIVFGHLLSDSVEGFPVPLYPRCLQKAHENAALVDFDMDILQEEVFRAVRSIIPEEKRHVLDAMRLHGDPSNLRYE